jgi:hypothetical protein
MNVCNKDAIVGDGDSLILSDAVFYFPVVKHTSTAMDDEAVRTYIFREIGARFKDFPDGLLLRQE